MDTSSRKFILKLPYLLYCKLRNYDLFKHHSDIVYEDVNQILNNIEEKTYYPVYDSEDNKNDKYIWDHSKFNTLMIVNKLLRCNIDEEAVRLLLLPYSYVKVKIDIRIDDIKKFIDENREGEFSNISMILSTALDTYNLA